MSTLLAYRPPLRPTPSRLALQRIAARLAILFASLALGACGSSAGGGGA